MQRCVGYSLVEQSDPFSLTPWKQMVFVDVMCVTRDTAALNSGLDFDILLPKHRYLHILIVTGT